MKKFYTNEKHIQIVIALMKAHGIKKVVASPGATNVSFVGSIQNDPYFEIYSSVDERSAAYIACGLSAESGEPVALSCTGATASRNYIPGLTEAFYRKLPILAITSTQRTGRIGHNIPQVIDRSVEQNDIFKLSVQVSEIYDEEDRWSCETKVNEAILALSHRGGGPVHINLTTNYSRNFSIEDLPKVNVIRRITYKDNFPNLNKDRIAIYVGAHLKWTDELTKVVDKFCETYNGIVFCDHTSNYKGKYRAFMGLVLSQDNYISSCANVDLLIHIGNISGAYTTVNPKEVWRVNPDGAICDTFRKLTYVFDMEEITFFEKYLEAENINRENTFLGEWKDEYKDFYSRIPELPFSNAWIAQYTASKLPENSILHLGILNTLRTWNYFESPKTILGYANTGGFGIDGIISSLIGASLSNLNKIFYGIVGDLAFFYDMNSIGNRHIKNNIRIMVINNGKGTEFRNYNHIGACFGDEADLYIAAGGHYGKKSPNLLKHYAEDLGFKYIAASNKDDYINNVEEFLNPAMVEKPILFEVFTDSKDESQAIYLMRTLKATKKGLLKSFVRDIVGEDNIYSIKHMLKK